MPTSGSGTSSSRRPSAASALRSARMAPRYPGRGGRRSCSAGHQRGHVARDDLHRLAVLRGRAELDDLGARLDDWDVPRGCVVGIAGLVHLVVVGVAERQRATEDVAPVLALAAVV